MSKFTPGPWEVDTVITSCGICHKIGPFPSGGHLEKNACIYVDNSDWSNSEELLANARLIAAAPEIYGLAKSIVWAENDDDIRLAKRLAKEIIAKIEENA